MGFGGISITQLIIILVIIILLFGTKKLKTLGSDLGTAIKGFKKSVSDDETKQVSEQKPEQTDADFSQSELKKDTTKD